MRRLVPLLALLLAACPETVGQQCPPKTVVVGQMALSFAGQHDAGECVQYLDGGADSGVIAQPFTRDDGGTTPSALCYGVGSDGGQQLFLAVTGKGARPSDLLPDGGFRFLGSTPPTSGICAGCSVAIDETFAGYLKSGTGDAGFALQADGGLPPITGLSGVLIDWLSAPQGGCQSSCNVPCPVRCVVTGTPY